MHLFFQSSKLALELQKAFEQILDGNHVKQGELRLKQLKKEKNFQLLLGNFIQRSKVYHQRLLAVIQLQERLIVQDVQTVWLLKQVYYKDNDKIARKICKIVTNKHNISLASVFLTVDFYQTGSKVYRQIQLIFHLLKDEVNSSEAILHHFELLYEYFINIINILNSNEDSFFLVMVCLVSFYQSSLRSHSRQELEQHWKQLQLKCYESQSNETHLMIQTIKKLVYENDPNYNQSAIFSLFNTCLMGNQPFKMTYLCKGLQLITNLNQIQQRQNLRQAVIQSIFKYISQKNKRMLTNLKLCGAIQIQFCNDLELPNRNEALVRVICNKQIKNIFERYPQWLQNQYLSKLNYSNERLQIFLAVINYYDSINLPLLPQIFPSILDIVVRQLNKHIQGNQQLHQAEVNQCITFIQFITKYRAQIQLSQLPNIVNILLDCSAVSPSLSSFSNVFLAAIWKQLSFLQLEDLTSFMIASLQKINQNQWAVGFESYECFLHLALYIEDSYSYFSTCIPNDNLLLIILNSHSIICEFLTQNTSTKMNFQLFHLLLALTRAILKNSAFNKSFNMYKELNIPFLIYNIQTHLFLDENTAIIVAYHRYHKQILVSCLQEESQEWRIDELDFSYLICLYLKEIQYATQQLAQSQLLRMKSQLGFRIVSFLKQISAISRKKMRESKVWQDLQQIYDIDRYVLEVMDIQIIC